MFLLVGVRTVGMQQWCSEMFFFEGPRSTSLSSEDLVVSVVFTSYRVHTCGSRPSGVVCRRFISAGQIDLYFLFGCRSGCRSHHITAAKPRMIYRPDYRPVCGVGRQTSSRHGWSPRAYRGLVSAKKETKNMPVFRRSLWSSCCTVNES